MWGFMLNLQPSNLTSPCNSQEAAVHVCDSDIVPHNDHVLTDLYSHVLTMMDATTMLYNALC